MKRLRIYQVLAVFAACASAVTGGAGVACADGVASQWAEGFNNKARLIAGLAAQPGDSKEKLFAAIEIALPADWKTYWRAPGNAGGIPPEFDFGASENVASVSVLYPAPKRLVDKSGTTIGYKDRVILPIMITPQDVAKPIHLKVKAAYGVCHDLCVPAEADLDLNIAPDVGVSPEIASVLTLVPRVVPIPESDPIVEKWRVETRDGKPILIFEVADPAIPETSDGGIDAVVDAVTGVYLPLPVKTARDLHRATFEVDLTDGATTKELEGLPLRIVLIGGKGQSETTIKLP